LRGKNQTRAERARSLRRALTPAEFALWTRIRGRQLDGFKFVRQEPIDRYYVDFVCRERRFVIELDGGQHSERPEDKRRDSKLCALGYRVIRICNNDVIENLDGVLQALLSELEKTTPHPVPLPASGARETMLPRTDRGCAQYCPRLGLCEKSGLGTPVGGEWSDHRDCHIRPDVILIYRKPDDASLEFVRLASHSELGL
jgi:very-short-patch-repair endonuclease